LSVKSWRSWLATGVGMGLLSLVLASPVAARATAWTLSSLSQLAPDSSPEPGRNIALSAAGGEVESFQIAIRGDESLDAVTIGVSDLAGTAGGLIPARDHKLFRLHTVTGADGKTYADALIPFRDPATGRPPAAGANLKAQPVDLDADVTQGFWVDLTVPRNQQSGRYRGTWYARSGTTRIGGGTIELVVWPINLPAAPGLITAFDQRNDHSMAADAVLLANRAMPVWADPAVARKLAAITPVSAAGLGFWSGAEDGSCRMSRPPTAAQIAQRVEAFPQGILLYNLTARAISACPELADEHLAWAEALHAGGIANLVLEPPAAEPAVDSQGKPLIDITVVGAAAYARNPAPVRKALADGRTVWAGTGLGYDRGRPVWLLGNPPLAYRLLTGFISQSLGFTGVYYWATDYWGGDAFNDVGYRSGDGRIWAGEGLLVYPGGAAGVQGVLPSVRLKRIRDGNEDFDLIALARAAGVQAVDQEIATVAGRDWEGATSDPAVLLAARKRLAEAIASR
jgi:hypothetical protein